MEKLPPEEKVYEAWTAIADGRVNLDEAARTATVRSSDGTQTYTIQWDADRREYSSNDNASYWRGYPGYPVIAVMMLQGVLPLDRTMAELYSEVNWRKLNTEYRTNTRTCCRDRSRAQHRPRRPRKSGPQGDGEA